MEEAISVLVEILEKDKDAVVILGTKDPSHADGPLKLINLRVLIDANKGGSDNSNQDSNSEQTLMILFIQLGSMRKTFFEYPEILLMDSTYITECGMPLDSCMVMDR